MFIDDVLHANAIPAETVTFPCGGALQIAEITDIHANLVIESSGRGWWFQPSELRNMAHLLTKLADQIKPVVTALLLTMLVPTICFAENDLGLDSFYFGAAAELVQPAGDDLHNQLFHAPQHDPHRHHHSHRNHFQQYQPVYPPLYFDGAPYGNGYYSPHGWYAYPQIIVVPPQPRGMWASPGAYGRHYYRFGG